MKIPIFQHAAINPLAWLGLTGSFWEIHIDTLIFTWIAMAMIFAIVFATRFFCRRHETNPFSFAVEQSIEFFVELCNESFGSFKYEYFAFITSIFIFTMFCNFSGLLPFVKEPTEDLNTALACGVSSFAYVQYQKIKCVGFWNYWKDFFKPIFILFPLNVVGEIAKAASMSFRLFGNILGGSIIVLIAIQASAPYRIHFMIYTALALPLLLLLPRLVDLEKHSFLKNIITINNFFIFSGAWMLMFFNLFEAVVQAFVITMLTTTYLSLISQNNQSATEKESPC